jgi:hypothetical protein
MGNLILLLSSLSPKGEGWGEGYVISFSIFEKLTSTIKSSLYTFTHHFKVSFGVKTISASSTSKSKLFL